MVLVAEKLLLQLKLLYFLKVIAKLGKNVILMADVIKSSKADQRKLIEAFKELVQKTNSNFMPHLSSPLTITLGDECQGIFNTTCKALEAIFFMEKYIFGMQFDFTVRYVLHVGEIDTNINTAMAYEMLGPGLTFARKMLTRKEREVPRFQIYLDDKRLSINLSRLFEVVDSIIQRWRKSDNELILTMFKEENNATVGKMFSKHRTQIWKRRKNLMINEFCLLEETIYDF